MNAECELIGRLLVNGDEIESASYSVTPEMITDKMYRAIYEKILSGQSNPALLVEALKDEYPSIGVTIKECIGYSLSLKQCVESIRNDHRARELKKALNVDINGSNVNQVIFDLLDRVDALKPKLKSKAKTGADLAKYVNDYFKPRDKGFMFGFASIDELVTNIGKGNTCLIGARPAVGKSAFALNLLKNNPNVKGGYFNLEMQSNEIYERWVSGESGIDMTHLRVAERPLGDELDRLKNASEMLSKLENVLFYDDIFTTAGIENECRIQKFDYIIVDYLQLLQPKSKNTEIRQRVTDTSLELKRIAMKYNVTIIALSQLNRASEMNKSKEPETSQLRESGSLEQDASVVLLMWGDEEDPTKRYVKVSKARNGKTGRAELIFDGAHMTFTDSRNKYIERELPF